MTDNERPPDEYYETDLARFRAAHEPGSDYWGVRCSGKLGTQHECSVWYLAPYQQAQWKGAMSQPAAHRA